MFQKLFIIIGFLMAISHKMEAQGDLLIAPIRIIFEGKSQKEPLNLTNIGKDSATYSISLIQYTMREDGSFTELNTPDSTQMIASPYLRIFPRKVVLAPGESQIVMLQYRGTQPIYSGEYRSHIYFRSEKNYRPLSTLNNIKDTSLLSVQLIPVYGLSIPVIIRAGNTDVTVKLSNLKVNQEKDSIQQLLVTINRTGSISTYGDIKVEFIPKQGKSYEIGLVKGVAVYTCINSRNVVLRLKDTEGLGIKNGKLKVKYICAENGKHNVYAESELDI